MTDNQHLIDLLTPDLRAGVEAGLYVVEEGSDPLKPVVRTLKKRLVKGTGRPKNANDIVVINKKTSYKRTKAFSEWFDSFIPAIRDESAQHAIITLEELIEIAAKVARGNPTPVACPSCEHRFEIPGKPDAKLLAFLIERRVGKAKETQEVSMRSEQIVTLLTDPTPLGQIEVLSLTPESRAERIRAVQDAEYRVLPEGPE